MTDPAPVSRLTLRQLILLLSTACVGLTLASTLFAGYRVQRELLIDNTLEANRVYALKLAQVTDTYLGDAQAQMAWHAAQAARHWDDVPTMRRYVDELRGQSRSFNSVVLVGADGRVQAVEPAGTLALGTHMNSTGARQALRGRRPMISAPYRAMTGRLIVFISHPVIAADGRYLGYLGGSIYLHADNILHALLGRQYYRDGSYFYVVDGSRQLIYHEDEARIGQHVGRNAVIDRVLDGQAGSLRTPNSRGVEMLAGYAPLQRANWGIVAQRPLAATLAGSGRLLWRTQLYSLPLLLLAVAILWWLSRLIARPLWQLAMQARRMDSADALEDIRGLHAWYFEAAQLKRSLLTGLGVIHSRIRLLNEESLTDALTGLYNRRGMQRFLETWPAGGAGFAVVVLDIDHFKRVNDTWGHDAGDRVLQRLADLIRQGFRPDDVACRSGGEEFAVFLPGATLDAAIQAAERFRTMVAASEWPFAERLTVSLGVAHFPDTAPDQGEVLKQADMALYRAKEGGRNRTEAAGA